jgi:hypothetical protein
MQEMALKQHATAPAAIGVDPAAAAIAAAGIEVAELQQGRSRLKRHLSHAARLVCITELQHWCRPTQFCL